MLVEKGGYHSPNSMIQDSMAFSHGLHIMSFLCPCYLWKRLFLHIHVTLMEFFDASPTITPKKGVSNSLKEKREKEEKLRGGICPIARRPDILVQT